MAANLQPISSDGGFTSGGNININSGSSIVTAINEDLTIVVQDEDDDGWTLKHRITDGIGNNLAETRLDSGSYTINLDMTGGDYSWQFEGNTLQVTNDTTIRGFNANVVTQAMVSGGNPVASLQVVDSVNDPNIFSTFDATSSGANIKVYNGGSNGGVEHAWQFDNDGNLTLPGNTFAVNYANGDQVPLGGSGNTGNVTFDDVTVQGDNQLNLSAGPDFTANLAYLQVRAGDVASHIHLDTGNNEAYDLIVGDDAKFVQVSSTGNIIMSSYDSGNTTSYIWTLDTTGNLILAGGNSVIQSVANSSLDPLNPNVSTMRFVPDSGYSSQSLVLDPTLPGHIHLRAPGANIDEPYANIFLGGEESSFEVGYHNGNAPNVFIHSGGNTWTFDNGGNLVFPRDAAGNTDPILTITGGANPRILSEDASLAGPANLEITALNTIFTGSSGSAIKIYADDGEIGSTANLQIWTNSGGNTEYSWTFGDDGNLTLPGNSFAVNYANGTQVSLGGSSSSIANGNSNVSIESSSGNISLSAGPGTSANGNIIFSTSGSNVLTLTELGEVLLPDTALFILGDSTSTNAAALIQVSGNDPRMILSNYASGNASSVYYPDRLSLSTDDYYVSIGQNENFYISNASTGASGTLEPGEIAVFESGSGGGFFANAVSMNYVDANSNGFTANANGGYHTALLQAPQIISNVATGTAPLTVTSTTRVANLNVATSGSVVNGNSNVNIATANGNVTIAAVGNTTMTVTGTGANVTGTLTSTGKIGYASGSTVTQTTNRGTSVTIDALAGTIVTVSASMVAGFIDTFGVSNNQVDPNNDIVLVQIVSPNFGMYNVIAQPSAIINGFNNGFFVNIQNISGGPSSTEAITIRFMVIKAPNA
jgi:hypothetical protein